MSDRLSNPLDALIVGDITPNEFYKEALPKMCPECGETPMGEGCYHICPNSVHYYSPEQERADDAHYDPSEYYREGGFADPDHYDDETTSGPGWPD